MSHFNYEKDLKHQEKAIDSVLRCLKVCDQTLGGVLGSHTNPELSVDSLKIEDVQKENNIRISKDKQAKKINRKIIDVMMETGTGKTYTYMKTMLKIKEQFNVSKFIIVVPSRAIQSGTYYFLTDDALRQHIKNDLEMPYQLHVEQVRAKSEKNDPRSVLRNFINARSDKNDVHVLLINRGMLVSQTLQESSDQPIFGSYDNFFQALNSIKPVLILDEPHLFKDTTKSFKKLIDDIAPPLMIRYGATFEDYHYLVYQLNAIDAFNQDLVKGVTVDVINNEIKKTATIKLKQLEAEQATFLVDDEGKKQEIILNKGDSLKRLHEHMPNLTIENVKKGVLLLNNGAEFKVEANFGYFIFADETQRYMLRQAIKNHFDYEEKLRIRRSTEKNGRIKSLSLFFIDNIASYRDDGLSEHSLRAFLEQCIEEELKERIKKLESELNKDQAYYDYYNELNQLLGKIPQMHGGYFSKDNINKGSGEKESEIDKQIDEILHNKAQLLSFDNPRRFIFSKWTLKEGWDNPNIFQICKMRSSGSEISKIQEVGRGLRLPVDEYGNRIKRGIPHLIYMVDQSEKDFAQQLLNDFNREIGFTLTQGEKIDNKIIDKITKQYTDKSRDKVICELKEAKIINDEEHILHPLTETTQLLSKVYPDIQWGVKENKIINKSDEKTSTVKIRKERYQQLRHLWEKINQKAIILYKLNKDEKQTSNKDEKQTSEQAFEEMFLDFLIYIYEEKQIFKEKNITHDRTNLKVNDNKRFMLEEELPNDSGHIPHSILMSKRDFFTRLAEKSKIQRKTLENAFNKYSEDSGNKDLSHYFHLETINEICKQFNDYLFYQSDKHMTVNYQKIDVNCHPTKFTDRNGQLFDEIKSSDLGRFMDDGDPSERFLFDKIIYDSEIESKNIKQTIKEVTVFTKIPKSSIKIPLPGGQSYSPDFAYVINTDSGKSLFLIIESKGVNSANKLDEDEKKRIEYAKKMFQDMRDDGFKVVFKTQFNKEQITEIIKEALNDA